MYFAERSRLKLILHGGLTDPLPGMVLGLRSWLLRSTDKIILSGLAAFSAGLRFWRIEAPGKFVFDEVYFPVYARNYLEGVHFFDSPPPLGKYIIAVGIRFFGFNPFGYRVMDALAGVLVIILIYKLGQMLFRSRAVGFLAAFFASLDGVLLVESRAGLINIFTVLFSLLAYYLFLRSGSADLNKRPWTYLAGAGIFMGAAVAVKWIGAASFGVIWAVYLIARLNRRWSWPGRLIASNETTKRIAGIHPALVLVLCFLLPLLVYASTFIVHVNQNPEYGFVELHKQMFGYHAHLQEGHGYASSWWSWPLLLRPVNYFWEVNPDHQTVQTILNLGNPILWWLGLVAVLFAIWVALFRGEFGAQFALLAVVLHYLPFALISRATFLYHFMGALPFMIMLVALMVNRLWRAGGFWREISAVMVLAIILAAVYFYPIWTGLPIPQGAFYQRMWLSSWI